MSYHLPVLAKECIEGLNIKPDGVYVDVTFGGGGHSRLIMEQLSDKGQLYGFDQDEDAVANQLPDDNFTFVAANFRHLYRFLRLHGVKQVDGILADLGVSSHQLDEGSRGFSFRFESELDMRMNQEDDLTAADILNQRTSAELQQIFGRYGEVRNAKTLAQSIVRERVKSPFKNISDFLAFLEPLVRGQKHRYLAQVFQALRIEVNDEMGALDDFLADAKKVLKPNGRLVVISYHSLEDRTVKKFFKTGNVNGEVIKDFYGNIERPFKIITKKAMLPTEEELKENSRSRSAKLRIGERLVD
ncbi:MAG: 16S rRNA (cytosine(1402)-N(4))-methyltransferase RsmH [Saprospiraceae bacterium]